MILILLRSVAEFPQMFCDLTLHVSVEFNVVLGNMGKYSLPGFLNSFMSSNFYGFILQKRQMTVFKGYLYHAEFKKPQIKLDCCTDN